MIVRYAAVRPDRQVGATVDVSPSCDLSIPHRQAERGQHFPHGQLRPTRLHALGRRQPAEVLVFEAREDMRQKRTGPDRVIIRKHDDLSGGVLDPARHLQALVGVWDGKDANSAGIDRSSERLDRGSHRLLGDDDDLLRVACKP